MTQLTPVSALSSSEQLQMQRLIEQKQLKDFMRLYSGLVSAASVAVSTTLRRAPLRPKSPNACRIAHKSS